MPEDSEKHFVLPNFIISVSGTLRGVLDNNATTRDKSYLNDLGTKKGEPGGVSMILKKRNGSGSRLYRLQLRTPKTTGINESPRQNNSGKTRNETGTKICSPWAC